MSLASLAVPTSAHPTTPGEIERRLEELARLRQRLEQREGDVRDRIADAGERREALTEELSELQAIVGEVQGRVDVAASALARVQAKVDQKDAALKKTQSALAKRLAELRKRAVQVYKRGPSSLFDIVLGVEAFDDLLRRFSYVKHVVEEDNERVADIRQMKSVIVRERNELKKLRDKAAAQVAVVTRERNRAAAIANEVASRRAAVSGELEQSYRELGDIGRQKAQYERETAQLQAESAAIAALLRGRGGGRAQVSPRGMVWPASGPVTSGFGWRTHPIFGSRRFHAGIDIGAPTGSAVVAAGSGTIVFVGMKGGYGNTVIVDHGGGIATLYGHLSSISSGTGAVVARGQRVGAVGCTGYCTGPHLHFEVRVNGNPVSPMGWLP